MYGLSKTGTVFVFRTSNLLLTPDATECTLEAKVQAASSGYKMISIKGGLLVKSDLASDYVYLNTSTFMLNRIKQFPDFELPVPHATLFKGNLFEFRAGGTSSLLLEQLDDVLSLFEN